jgi:hypothetical protein
VFSYACSFLLALHHLLCLVFFPSFLPLFLLFLFLFPFVAFHFSPLPLPFRFLILLLSALCLLPHSSFNHIIIILLSSLLSNISF